jgi:integrase
MARERKDPFEVDWNEGATTTFGEVARRYLNDHFPEPSKQRREAEHMLFTHAKELVEKPLIRIRASHIADVLRPLSRQMTNRFRRVLTRIEGVFDYAKSKDLYPAENPARWKEKQKSLFPGFKNKRGHFDAMPYEDVPEFMRKLRQRQDSSVAAVALEFLTLTALRSGEVRGLRWTEVKLGDRILVIPPERMKKGEREHIVPLSERAIEILKRRKEHSVGQYVFSAHQRNKPLDEKAMPNILNGIVTGYTVHGLRSSFSDWANDQPDYAWETIEECLSHKVGNTVRNAAS